MNLENRCEAQIKYTVNRPQEPGEGNLLIPGYVQTEVWCNRCQFYSRATAGPINNSTNLLSEMQYVKGDARIMIKTACKKWREQVKSPEAEMPDSWFPDLD